MLPILTCQSSDRWSCIYGDDRNRAQVGVIGYHTLLTSFQTSIGLVRFNDIISSTTRCVSDFKEANPDVKIVVALSHAGTLTLAEFSFVVHFQDAVHAASFCRSSNGYGMRIERAGATCDGLQLYASRPYFTAAACSVV